MNPSVLPSRARKLARVQALSGLAFVAFSLTHLLNTMLASRGPETYDAFQRAVRVVYQFPLVELSLVIVPLVVHVVAAVARARLRTGRAPPNLRMRLHRYAGWFLALVMLGHIGATRGPSLFLGVYPEFAGVSWAFTVAPWFFYPYYAALGAFGLYHSLHGLMLALGVLGVRVPRALQRGPGFWVPVGLATALVVLGVLSAGGALFDVADPSAHPFAVLGREVLSRLP